MKILTYKRTHTGDPDAQGNFGIHDCMGRVRNWNFDAVIGVGSLKPWIGDEGIAGRVTWVGINPRRILNSDYRGDILNFENFLLLDSKGPLLQDEAPLLFKRMFERNARAILNSYSIAEKKEAEELIIRLINDPRYMKAKSFASLRVSKCKKYRRKCDDVVVVSGKCRMQ